MPSAGAVRRAMGFARYAVSVQYHGGSFLGFTYQGPKREDCLFRQRKKSGKMGRVDQRGHRSAEGRLREALDDLLGEDQWENIQVSSRTDRGVHALKNTFHVDVKLANSKNDNNNNDSDGAEEEDSKENRNENTSAKQQQQQQQHQHYDSNHTKAIERKLRDGLNFYLSRQFHGFQTTTNHHPGVKQNPMMNELRILDASKSPEYMDNPYALTNEGRATNQPSEVDWNARFSATQRTYVYRILSYGPRRNEEEEKEKRDETASESFSGVGRTQTQHWSDGLGIPFEWDRAWCLPQSRPLDVEAMKEAAECFVGTHDFSSFWGKLCQRKSPIVSMESVTIEHESCAARSSSGGLFVRNGRQQNQLVTIAFVANSFLYRQVRNMVGCLVEVGKHGGRLSPKGVTDLLLVVDEINRKKNNQQNNRGEEDCSEELRRGNGGDTGNSTPAKSKHRLYSTAPPQGLFLVDVQHGNFRF